jgi:hypothetical protein
MKNKKKRARALAVLLAAVVSLWDSGQVSAAMFDTGAELSGQCVVADFALRGLRPYDSVTSAAAGICLGYISAAVEFQKAWAPSKVICVEGTPRKQLVALFANWALSHPERLTNSASTTFTAFLWDRFACDPAKQQE